MRDFRSRTISWRTAQKATQGAGDGAM